MNEWKRLEHARCLRRIGDGPKIFAQKHLDLWRRDMFKT
jgi:hypothetical protein